MDKWIVHYTYLDGFTHKKSYISIEAMSSFDARRKAESLLKEKCEHLMIIDAELENKPKEEYHSVLNDLSPETKAIIVATEAHEKRIKEKEKEILRIRNTPFIILLVGSLISIILFAISWSPFAYFNSSYNDFLEAGAASEAELADIKSAANNCLIIPFIVLVVALAIVALLFFVSKKRRAVKLDKALKELESIKKENILTR